MQRVETNADWSLFCPNEAPGLADCWGEQHAALYQRYEEEGRAKKVIKAQQLWFAILEAQVYWRHRLDDEALLSGCFCTHAAAVVVEVSDSCRWRRAIRTCSTRTPATGNPISRISARSSAATFALKLWSTPQRRRRPCATWHLLPCPATCESVTGHHHPAGQS